MKVRGLLFFVLVLFSNILLAQNDFRKGFVIIQQGDTLYGEIDYKGSLSMSEVCIFRLNENEPIIRYSPLDIIAYRFIDSKYFVLRKIDNKKVFLEYLINGIVNIYFLRDEKGDRFFIDKEGEKISEIPYDERIINIYGRELKYKSTKHIGVLGYYMKDAPELQKEINKIEKPKYESLVKLAEDYHHYVCKGEECIIYKENLKSEIFLSSVCGIINFINMDDIKDKNYFLYGVSIQFSIPRANEKIFIKSGLMLSNVLDYSNNKAYYIRVPLHIGFVFPNTYKIRPFVSVGIIRPSYSGGLMVNLNERINIGIESTLNYLPDKKFILTPKLDLLYNYSFLAKIYFKL